MKGAILVDCASGLSLGGMQSHGAPVVIKYSNKNDI